jgi:asparagine synthase (glutamine-hydrolysing)
MCGIAGIVSDKKIPHSVMENMVECLAHRGPDATGVYKSDSGQISLGHRRLSILDLSEAANQPFHSANNRYAVTFNGEIYNYKSIRSELREKYGVQFKTNSDTEVIAEGFSEWGVALATKLDGMFAIGIFDKIDLRMFLFRDRVGKKPLYYFQSEGYFAFASEIKSLLRDLNIAGSVRVNTAAISSFLHLGYIPEPNTIYHQIKKFPAGCVGEISVNNGLQIKSYWTIDETLSHKTDWSVDGAKERLKTLLDISVKKRLLSDVPLGTFLSGGTDSSLVTAFALKHTIKRLKTFSIGFQESKHNESKYASAVAKHLGTYHHEYILSETDAIELIEKYTSHFDEPFADTSAIPTMMVSRLARQEVKVILTGDGGDELFQGYGAYRWANRLDSFPWRFSGSALHAAFKTFGSNRLKRISYLLAPVHIGGLRSHIFSQEQYLFSQDEIKNKLLRNQDLFLPFKYHEDFANRSGYSEAEKQAIFDLKHYLKDDLLVKVDRASMYYGLECRCPLLDYKIIEFAFSLPDSFKYKNDSAKWLLKEILKEYLPTDLVHRPKWGFSVPLAKWLKGELHYLIQQYLSTAMIEEIGLFNSQYVQSLVKEFMGGRDYLYNRLWVLIVLHKSWKEKNYQV